jgi:hypothetical protein
MRGSEMRDKEKTCWVCKELIKVGKVKIEFLHITKELNDFKFCPRCGRNLTVQERGMKTRKMLISITMRTDISMKFLEDKRRWQCFMDRMHDDTKDPLADYAIVEKVDAIKLK